MNDEIQKILKMLEDGKISAAEAKELLEAVSSTDEKSSYKNEKSKWEDSISGNVSGIINEVLSWLKSDKVMNIDSKYNCDGIKAMDIKCFGGNIKIKKSRDNNLEIDNLEKIKGKVKKDGEKINFRIFSSDLTLYIPKKIEFINIAQLGGDLNGEILAMKTSIKSKGGDIDISFNNIENLEINSMGGDITVNLPENIDGKFDIDNVGGDFSSDISYEKIKENKKHITGKFNKGENTNIKIDSLGGDIRFKKL